MAMILGVESTAHTFGVAVVKNGKVLSNCKRVFMTKEGGMIPTEVAKFHFNNKNEVYFEALDSAGISELDIDAVAFSQGPGLTPCLLEGLKFVKEISKKLKKPMVPVNHCIAHLEIGKLTGAKYPVMLYASGANTQIIAYASGKYRIFGETLDLGIGNFIDTFARYAGIGFPGGSKIEELASNSKKYIELPYSVKGMDVAFSGILTNLKQKLESKSLRDYSSTDTQGGHENPKEGREPFQGLQAGDFAEPSSKDDFSEPSGEPKYKLNDLAYSMQETVFAMLVETAERALAHTGKNELLLGGGVACNSRLQEMCKIMCSERGAKFFCPEKQFLVDNSGMIAYLGEIMFKSGIKISYKNLNKLDIKPRQRTDDVEVRWR